jgi:hypothetical protein
VVNSGTAALLEHHYPVYHHIPDTASVPGPDQLQDRIDRPRGRFHPAQVMDHKIGCLTDLYGSDPIGHPDRFGSTNG